MLIERSKIWVFEKEDHHLEICKREKTIKTEACKGGTRKTFRTTGLKNKVLAILHYIAAILFHTKSGNKKNESHYAGVFDMQITKDFQIEARIRYA